MQLLIILALLLYGGKNNAQNVLAEVKPVLESIGGEEMKEALKSAEEISSVLSAVKEFTGGFNGGAGGGAGGVSSAFASENFTNPTKQSAISFPLQPISAVADKDITYSLSKYISQN